jgi:hypothetical protein
MLHDMLAAQQYRNFLETVLPSLLEDTPLAARQILRFQHNRAPANDALNGRLSSKATKPEKWVARRGPSPWIPRSPDLNLRNSFSCRDT